MSRTPGRTQLINFFELGNERRLVDLPGYGFAKVPEQVRARWLELMEQYFNVRESLVGLVLIVDSRRGLGAAGQRHARMDARARTRTRTSCSRSRTS